ncbi:MAG: hypothetical protein CMO55_17105 [Verrucomicrobiales bacterium]|nr:hypothetical protein [Verrucomicrobiales bacterium]
MCEDKVSLIWVKRPPGTKTCNFGDALSPIVTALVSGKEVVPHRVNDEHCVCAVGTIGHSIEGLVSENTSVSIWGTGIDVNFDPRKNLPYFKVYRNSRLRATMTRGAISEMVLKHNGVDTSGIYGDPAWIMKKVLPIPVKKKYDIGVVLHLSELEDQFSLSSSPRDEFVRYKVSEGDSVRIISTVAERSVKGVIAKINEIRSCKVILSVSLHGVIIAEAFGIPCAHFHFAGRKGIEMSPIFGFNSAQPIDHRFRDFYSGIANRNYVLCYRWPRSERLDYSGIAEIVASYWEPIEYDESKMIESFPEQGNISISQEHLLRLERQLQEV